MLVDLIGLLVVTLMGWLGWRRGLLLSLLQIVGLAAGYLAAWTLYRPVGRALGGVFSLQPLLSYPLGGLVAFVAGVSLFGVLGLLLRRRRRRRAVTPGTLDRVGGAVLGGAHGLALVLVLAWAAVTLQSVATGVGHAAGPSVRGAGEPRSHAERSAPDVMVRDSVVGRMALPLVVALARHAGAQTGSETMGEAAGSFARDPLRTIGGLADDAEVQRLVQDPELQRLLRQRDLMALANNPTFNRLAEIVVQATAPGRAAEQHQ